MLYEWNVQRFTDAPTDFSAPSFLKTRLGQDLFYKRFIGPQALIPHQFAWASLDDITDPSDIPELQEAAQCLVQHLEEGGPICIFSDYDVDGICGGVLLYEFLRAAYPDLKIEIRHSDRFSEGYGLHIHHVESLADFNCVLTVDCGSSSVRAVQQLSDSGCDVVITDHHECILDQEGNIVRPEARAFVNPKRPDFPHYYSFLSGTGVGLMLCVALRRFSKACEKVKLAPFLDLVCTSVISDSVPLVRENRLIVQYGLKLFNHCPRPFFRSLLDSQKRYGPIDETTLSYTLIPKLNAPGRLGSTDPILHGLLAKDIQQLEACVRSTLEQNQVRMTIQQKSWELIEPMAEERRACDVICVFHPHIHEGVLGILASRISEKTHKPAIVLCPSQNEGEIKGSGRGFGSQSVFEVLKGFSGFFKQFGGHHAAVGLTLPAPNLQPFCEAMDACTLTQKQPSLAIESWVDLSEISIDTAVDLQQLGPYGQDFPEPVFSLSNMGIPKLSLLKETHLKGTLESPKGDKLPFIGWKLGHMAPHLQHNQRYDVALKLKLNHYLDMPTVQCEVVDVRSASMTPHSNP